MEEDIRGTELGNVIRIDDDRVREHLGRIVRGTVEETLNAMLEAEADRLCNAGRYEPHGGASGSAVGKLRSEAADQGGRGDAESAEAAPAGPSRRQSSSAIGGARAR